MSVGLFSDPVFDAGLAELAELQREKACAFAREMRVLAGLGLRTCRDGWQAEAPRESLLLEIAGTCQLGQFSAGSRMEDAEHLVVRLPGTLALLEAGELLVPPAMVLIAETRSCSAQVCAEVEQRMLPSVAGRAPGRLRERVRAAVLAVDAEHAARKAAAARSDRRVWSRPAEDGMAMVYALAPAEHAARLMSALTARARQLLAAGDPRSIDQLRADLLCAWRADSAASGSVASRGATAGAGPGEPTLASPAPAPPAPAPAPDDSGPVATGMAKSDGRRSRDVQVIVHVPVATALGLSDEPGHLQGYGPLNAADTRRLMAEAELRKICVDSRTGRVVAAEDSVVRPAAGDVQSVRDALVDMVLTDTVWTDSPEPQHDPSAPLARFVRLRDRGCDGIGCSVDAEWSELDHHVAYPDGPTSAGNLKARSQRCHHAKHHGWTVVMHADGSSEWTSPGGRNYRVPSRDDPPPAIPPDAELPTPEQLRARDDALRQTSDDVQPQRDWDEPDW